MAAAGLRTKVLLADATSAALGAAMIEPVLADPEAMGHIGGAVGYHPWAGDFRWPYWRDVAARHGLALLVTEIGADPFAWKTGALGTAHYALDDVRRHLEVLNVSGAQSLLTWEWTGNYGVLDTAVDGALAPTMRYWMLWQLTRLSPTPGRVLVTATDRPDDVVAATLLGDGPAPAVAVHVGNLADGRPITVTGLPPHVTAVYVATSTPAGGLTRGAAAVVVSDGRVTVDVPAWSMVTLTTAPIPDPPTEW